MPGTDSISARDAEKLSNDHLNIKAAMAAVLTKTISELDITQMAASKQAGISQTAISMIGRGKLANVSIPTLRQALLRLGHDIEVRISPRHDGVGDFRTVDNQ